MDSLATSTVVNISVVSSCQLIIFNESLIVKVKDTAASNNAGALILNCYRLGVFILPQTNFIL
jgi:predicted RecA/RadA family phage recombinase